MSKPPPAYNWPKPYLLKIYDLAIEQGCCRVNLSAQADPETAFKSLKASFYRLRRRTDTQAKNYVRPEFDLCSISYESSRQSALVTFNSLPDGHDLPPIEELTQAERQQIAENPRLNSEPLSKPKVGPKPDLNFDEVDNVLRGLGIEPGS